MGGIDSNTQLMLHFNGTHQDYVYNEAQYLKPVFKDSSINNHPVFSVLAWWQSTTLGSSPYIDCSISKFGGASGWFNFDTNLLIYGWPCWSGILPDSLQPQGGDFTIDCWIYWDTLPAWSEYHSFRMIYDVGLYIGSYLTFGYNSNDYKLYLRYSGHTGGGGEGSFLLESSDLTLADTPIEEKKWFHIAAVRNGTSFKLYWHGQCVGSMTSSVIMTKNTDSYAAVQIGGEHIGGYSYGMAMNLDELRYSNIARWTEDFDVPTGEYTNNYFHNLIHGKRYIKKVKNIDILNIGKVNGT